MKLVLFDVPTEFSLCKHFREQYMFPGTFRIDLFVDSKACKRK